jgi:putative toxin-antitoxin system antitoxin component (TIGR02293 family)
MKSVAMAENLRPSGVGDGKPGKRTAETGPHSFSIRLGARKPVKQTLAPRGMSKTSAAEASVLDRAVEVIGEKGEAMRWMGTPIRALDYATPVSLLATAKGRATVLAVLGRIEHGVM